MATAQFVNCDILHCAGSGCGWQAFGPTSCLRQKREAFNKELCSPCYEQPYSVSALSIFVSDARPKLSVISEPARLFSLPYEPLVLLHFDLFLSLAMPQY